MTLAQREIRSSSQAHVDDAAHTLTGFSNAALPNAGPASAGRSSAGLPPAFKPVALPALTAAVRAAYREPPRKPTVDFPTLLRISAMLD
jgi:hypothetical protein